MRRLREWILRFSGLFNRQRKDRDLDDEIESHLQLHIEDNLRFGMTPEEARREALIKLGGIESTKGAYRDQRGLPMLETLWQDVRYGARMLRKNPGFTTVAVLTFGIGLALTAATFATVNAYLIRSLPYPTARRVYHVMYAPPGPYEPRGMSLIDWKSLKDVVEDTINFSTTPFYLTEGGSVKTMRSLQVSPGFIRGLGVRTAAGRAFFEEEFDEGSEPVAMIGQEFWQARFGSDPEIIGRQIQVMLEETGRTNGMLRIVGVLPAGFWFGRDSSASVDILTPLRSRPQVAQTYLVCLREGVPVSLAEQRITGAARSVGSDFRPGWAGVHLQSMRDRYVESIRPVLLGVSIAVGTVLILVCANVSILILLRAMGRQKEMAVRVALGAGRTQIMRMLGAEVFLLCGASLALGLALSEILLRLLAPLIEAQLGKPAPAAPSSIQMDWTVLLVLGGVSILIASSLAFIPLLASCHRRGADCLRSQGSSATDGPFMRRVRVSLIGIEVAGSLVLLVGCGLMIRSALNLINANLGFNPERVLRAGIRLPARTYADAPSLHRFYTSLIERLPHETNSRVTLMSAFPPFYPANAHRFEIENAKGEQAPVGMMRVGADYFNLYEVKLRRGREFTTDDRLGSEPVALLSETLAAALWPEGTAIGRRIRVAESDMPGSPLALWRTVVGVVADIRQGYDDSDLRDIYLPFLQSPTRFAAVHVRTDRPLSFWEKSIRATAQELDPYVQLSPAKTILSEDRRRAGTRFLTSMLTGFAIFAALLTILGIYGVTRYSVQQREREIAIRTAVGASKEAIIALFLKDGVRVLSAGLCLGLLGTFAVARILANLVYGVRPFDLATLGIACALLATSGLAAMWWPARRAALRSPIDVLKEA